MHRLRKNDARTKRERAIVQTIRDNLIYGWIPATLQRRTPADWIQQLQKRWSYSLTVTDSSAGTRIVVSGEELKNEPLCIRTLRMNNFVEDLRDILQSNVEIIHARR